MPGTVVVLGGGLAGVSCAQRLADGGLTVTVVDRHDYLQFQPLLYQVASSQLPAQDVAGPLTTVFGDQDGVTVEQADVVKVSFADRSVTTADGRTFTADYLVVAAGSQPNFFGIPGAAEHSFPMYSVADAERLRLQLRAFLATAEHGADDTQAEPVDIVVVGGGATGVETSGAIAEIITVLGEQEKLKNPARIHLVDRGTALLPQFSDKAHRYAMEKLAEHDVHVMLGTGVARVDAGAVHFDDGTTLATSTLIWAGGSAGAQVTQHAGRAPGRGGRVDVEPDLTVAGFPGVYAIGDAANIPDKEGRALPQLGSVAQQSGRHAAKNILHAVAGEKATPFRYKDKGIMAMIGRNAAVAEVGKHRHEVDGPVAFAAWLGVHAMLLSGVHSKSDAFLEWGWDYFDRDHAATLESHSNPQRILWGDDAADVPHIDLERAPVGGSRGAVRDAGQPGG